MTIPPLSHHAPAAKTKKTFFDIEDKLKVSPYCRQFLYQNKIKLINAENRKPLLLPSGLIEIKPLKGPYLIQGIDLKKVYYRQESKRQLISYQELLDMGLMIYMNNRKRKYYIKEHGYYGEDSIPFPNQKPNGVSAILHDLNERTIKLLGERCESEPYEI